MTESTWGKRRLWDEEDFPCGSAGLEVAVGLGGIGERVDVLDAES